MSLFPGLTKQLSTQYEAALEAKEIVECESEIIPFEESGIPFEIRLVSALANKPAKSDGERKEKPADPFAPPYIPSLFVAESTKEAIGDGDDEEYVVLLNKFCVVPRHFLLVTKEFAQQNTMLSPCDLYATYSILADIAKIRKEPEHLAFSTVVLKVVHLNPINTSNSSRCQMKNPLSCSRQEHKPQREGDVFFLPMLPFANFFCALPSKLSTRSSSEIKGLLVARYLSLIDAMVDHSRHLSVAFPDLDIAKTLSTMSYNFIMTADYLQLVPRSKEKYIDTSNGIEISVNSLGLGGMLLVKSQNELEMVKKGGVLEVLKNVTWPLMPADSDAVPGNA